MYKALHSRDDVDWLYVSRKGGIRGLASIQVRVDASIQKHEDYDPPPQKKTQQNKNWGRLFTATRNNTDNTSINRTKIKKTKMRRKTTVWIFQATKSEISHDKTLTWLRKGSLKRETESRLIAAQNNAIETNYVKARIDKTQQNSWYRLCGDWDETINHIINECSKLAQKEYKTRPDWVGKVNHWELCKKFQFEPTNK